MRSINTKAEIEKIAQFLKDYLLSSGFDKYILGVSGGIDSALSAALAVKAIGKKNVIGLLMPYRNSNPDSTSDAKLLCHTLDIEYQTIDISPMVDAWFDTYESEADNLRRGNLMARCRMCILYDLSAKYKALVLGTSNLSEIMTGYFTQFGDSAAAIEPLAQLYKSEVWQLSKDLGIPAKIISKVPTADLWPEQSDEKDMGISYQDLDSILWAIHNMNDLDEYPADKVKTVFKLIARSAFKRNPAPIPEAPCSL
ncbi:MAG: NAD+ synthase [Candidatus Cloacimonadales bacterium]|jgi:NAD+ synthase|nr:NAD+ synthase [Candidatus Cloacimonadota bacterium]MDY0380796.1 NAD+ synthase [Candidatus Cloacimonadaceae bacterium]HCM15519.1 NAD(+) synthetase [Candidatus Cloacimonas sp.]MCB5256224.1 NAD+ synthase [Candidatus Cloacimonadota bacterium]MCB5264300.1 NAD+ synthase [Candidatus Cloacimonadota bacterium]